MAQEIERKFLVTGDFKQAACNHTHIVQGYISATKEHTVRIRIRDDKGYITIKGPSTDNGLSRYEWEKELSLCEAQELMQLCKTGVIDKVRYLVKSGQHIFEVDEFHGANEGLIVAEVELQSPDEEFLKPSFIGQEVTGIPRYYNSHLMEYPYSKWSGQ